MDLPVSRRPDFQTLEGLLGNTGDWRNIQDIIRITFRALADTVRRHEAQIQELSCKQEDVYTALTSTLQHKVSEPELLSAITDLERRLSAKTDHLEASLSEKPGFDEVQALLRPKVNLEEVAHMLDSRAAEMQELANQLSVLDESVDTLSVRLTKTEDTLTTKANSETVATHLRKKASREDLDTALARKADLTLLQDLVSAVEAKADQHWVEELGEALSAKTDTLTPRADLEELAGKLKEVKAQGDRKHTEVSRSLEVKTNNLAKDFEALKTQLQTLSTLIEQTKTTTDRLSSRKADLRDLDGLAALLSKKADLDYMSHVVATSRDEVLERLDVQLSAIKTQRDDQLHEQFADSVLLRDSLRDCQAEVQRLAIVQQHNEEQGSLAASASSDLRTELELLRKDVREALTEVDMQAHSQRDLAEMVERGLAGKSDLVYVEQELDHCQKTLLTSLQTLKEDLRRKLNSIEGGLRKQLDSKPTPAELRADLLSELRLQLQTEFRNELQAELTQRLAEQSYMTRALATKAEHSDFEVLRDSLTALREDLNKRATQADLSLQVAVLKAALDEAAQDIASKAGVQEICTLLDSKANVDDVNSTLQALHESVAGKVSGQEFREWTQAESQVLEGLVGRSLEARWSWSGTELQTGSQVPWNQQALNTAPDLFVWERSKPAILIAAAGLFEVTCAFFARKRPSIQVQVNGETVLTSSSSSGVQTKKGAGQSLREFLLVPARSRLTVLYAGESLGEGFLALRKL